MSVGLRWTFASLAVAMFLLTAASLRHFLAEIHSFQGKRYEQFWQSRGGVPSARQWNRAAAHMERAIALNSGNPDIWLRAGRVMEWYTFVPDRDTELFRERLKLANDAYDNAIALRPMHGGGLSARALLKARRWHLDENLSEDMARAVAAYPWEVYVLRRVARAGLFAWPELDEQGKKVVTDLLLSASEFRPPLAREMLATANEFGHEDSLCIHVSELDFLVSEHQRYHNVTERLCKEQ